MYVADIPLPLLYEIVLYVNRQAETFQAGSVVTKERIFVFYLNAFLYYPLLH
jgi:hypothetical protein